MLVNNKPKRLNVIRDHLDIYSSAKLEYDYPMYHSPLRFRTKCFTSGRGHFNLREQFYYKDTYTFRSVEYDLRNEYIEYRILPLSWYNRVLYIKTLREIAEIDGVDVCL